MKAYATATVGLLAFGLLALGACGGGGSAGGGPYATVLEPCSFGGIEGT